MTDVSVVRTPDRGEVVAWDAFVAATADTDVSQLSAWADVRRVAGFEPVYVFARGDVGELVGGAQVLVRRFAVAGSVGYVPYGPVLGQDLEDRAGVRDAIARALERLSRRELRLLFLQPPRGADDVSAELLRRGFRPSDARVAPQASARLDLSLDEDALRQRMNGRLRGWTTRWADRGVTVRLGTRQDLPLLADLLARTAQHQGFEPLSLTYVQTLYDALARNGNVVVFVGEVERCPVGVDLLTCCGGVVRDRIVGFDRSSRASKLSVPGAIKWEVIRWARANEFRWFDFGGLGVQTAETLLSGGRVDLQTATGGDWFKVSFGGEPYLNPPAVEAASSRLVLQLYDQVRQSEHGRRLAGHVRRRLRAGS
jgi:lipid II:glycine glycyltransferase (peptidoglycan interpeptide bridge formation enzyme)